MKIILAALAIAAVASSPACGAPCKDAKGKLVKCPEKTPAKPMRCKDAQGKFAKCGTPGTKPV